jgi:ABC-2 type transport system ATP-binding protein
VSRRHIRCASTLPAAEVGRWPGVVDVAGEPHQLCIVATDAEGVVRRLLSADPHLSRLEVRQAGLTEAFNELTREAA